MRFTGATDGLPLSRQELLPATVKSEPLATATDGNSVHSNVFPNTLPSIQSNHGAAREESKIKEAEEKREYMYLLPSWQAAQVRSSLRSSQEGTPLWCR